LVEHEHRCLRVASAPGSVIALAQDLGVNEALASDWFDEWRDF
jgi:hypothetical protein